MRDDLNVTIDYMGCMNEGGIPSHDFVIGLRRTLDAAGFENTLIIAPDTHDAAAFSVVKNLDPGSEYGKALGVVGVHEPLRTAESVPAYALASGKPLWSSEAYTTYSDSNGGGCWARALNWGWVKGSITAHVAWNLIQSYPSVGSGMAYTGHGLMWAEVPWAGHYTVNSPIWVTAHYTQTTRVGWTYLPVGSGSGDLPGGGTFLTLVSAAAGGRRDFSLVMQTMEYTNSKCFKDAHPPFTVTNQTVTFQLSKDLRPAAGVLHVRRSILHPGDPIDPVRDMPGQRNVYYEEMAGITLDASGSFSVDLPVNAIVTVSTLRGSKGSHMIPKSTPFPYPFCDALSQYPDGQGGRYFDDQQGVWESRAGVMVQAVPMEPNEWHGWGRLSHPHTFVGPSVTSANISCTVRPVGSVFAGVGVGPQVTGQVPSPNMLAVFANGTWKVGSKQGSVAAASWYKLALEVDAVGRFRAQIDGTTVAEGAGLGGSGAFPFLGAGYAADGEPAFKDLCIDGAATPEPTPAPPPPPSPRPPAGSGLAMVACEPAAAEQQWTFSGEDGGETGYLRPAANSSLCLSTSDLVAAVAPCAGAGRWNWTSASAAMSTAQKRPCVKARHGSSCNMCLDVMTNGTVDLFDCWYNFEAARNSNQVWVFDPAAGAGPLKHAGKCLGLY
eukprot:TRINITY_DN4772_c0_g1_i2.p1 TRINITY_DN4772_c0_g1~~TRINITY_DN4772_c0_g1_i2.p1  ORF type:complete len:664 (+),score=191.51 TRINITY_DN4772_c0_g1_i2:507-2498(+)